MLDLRLISEPGVNDTLLTIEPSRRCVGHCTYCYVELNRRSRGRADEAPATFARTLNRAFSPDYDPADFLQWGLRNRLPLCWSSGVEPFQDPAAARAVLDAADRLGLPLFVQTRGTGWRGAWDRLRPLADNVCLYVSLPSMDPDVVRRFEPGTPGPAERLALVDAAVAAGIPTMVAMAPYRPEWCPDPAAHVADLAARGVKAILFDPLHLNDRQREAATDREMIALAARGWDDETIAHATAAFDACLDLDLSWWSTDRRAAVWGLGSVDPFAWMRYRDARPFGYHDETYLGLVQAIADRDDRPLLLTWEECLRVMEYPGAIDQRFAWGPIRNAWNLYLSKLAPGWQARLKPAATLREHLRALWNRPSLKGFVWGHPFVRMAVRPDGAPWTSPSGDLVLAFDPSDGSCETKAALESIEDREFFHFTPEGEDHGERRRGGGGAEEGGPEGGQGGHEEAARGPPRAQVTPGGGR